MDEEQVIELTGRRVGHCPACGYALEGLPLEGNCPECGRQYDQASFIFHGYGRGGHSHSGNATPRAAYAWASLTAVILLLCLSTFLWSRRSILHDAGAAVVILLPFAAMFLQRSGNGFPGLVQVWLTPAGCGQKDELYTDPFWHRVTQFVGLPLTFLYLSFSNVHREGWTGALLLFSVLVLAMAAGAFTKRQQRAKLVKSSIPSAPHLTGWTIVQRVSLERLSSGRHRIRVTAIDDRREVTPVDAEVHCSEAQAAEVRRQAEQWIQQARYADPRPIG